MFIAHGTNHTTVPTNQSTRLSAALFAAGVSHDYRAVPLAGHGLDGPIVPDVGTPFCSGDGSAAPCPCGNKGTK